MKVQCISTKCGFHKELKIGRWYEVSEVAFSARGCESNRWYRIIDDDDLKKYGVNNGFLGFSVYEKSLFRTLDESRESKLNKILK